MASEIEILAETPTRESEAAASEGINFAKSQEEENQRRNDVYTAAAYGDLEKLKRLVEEEGCSVSEPDASGYYALQWSALNNRAAAAQYLLEHGAHVDAADFSGQTALHWTAVRGSLQVAELLLEHGARLEIYDSHGYRTSHVAAQYGQTSLLYHLVTKWNADVDPPDNDGRSPLHWAAYKGFADCIRYLLFMDAYLGRQDKEGCTPLHWAAIRGNLEACTVLVQAGSLEDLMTTEATGCTAAQLASDKGHRHVALFLSNARRIYNNRWDGKGRLGRIQKMGLAPVLWVCILAMVITFTNSVIISPSMVRITAGVGAWAWMTVFLATGGLFLLYRCSSKDPGYIIRSSPDQKGVEDPLLKPDFSNPALAAGYWAQLCPTCKIVRPLRSKHCASCNRCVEQFDHHCPWISNCVGKMNKWDFFVFLVMETCAMIIGASVTINRLYMDPHAPGGTGPWLRHVGANHPGALAFLLFDVFLFFGVATLTGMQAAQIARNITTNEMTNSLRYNYLKGTDGRFRNPYDHGCRKNCSDFLLNGHNDDSEVRLPPPMQNGGMVQMVQHSHLDHTNSGGDVENPGVFSSAVGAGGARSHHVHGATCNHSHDQTSAAPLGLGLGLPRPNGVHHNNRRISQ
ncbi:palmitoyltransferase ZDHHC13/17 [Marchantia polymorpha subsp. ruderalis]|uniref:S-acyltransferase n=2 Tax=Marchantia polymorpha TaxID=3197 RepID=A0A176WHY9_MARPO|nr:hypothetical protein AXG93_4485s1020 [Marchantia polymorpha subsp. ruderalis]PTQ46298.1 hypothetical protein MARPO_0011s0006 [Marchantia polymorpha]PTQ46299.1 hypothetical protein MARPO_0011s0006 [Marchantia polymorpha]BBN08262.1 hypothetical protein Mp_4g10190 [Marchantia polymorpha subsp. ruderalis]BBN08263.1 hypothetical protein Mp_4g10190 [Marchantia polymorpha subsp. ruderalis]|eukprot:PTQ46298.1 hypothetical protein MARPO_0011s0006 [Marchantia polymorpha]